MTRSPLVSTSVRSPSWGEVATEPVDVVLVAGLVGHADLNTIRRSALPTDADKACAPEALTTGR
ncbi:hypothetical protein [Nocardiopsis halotolerans]|uniref:hypothetical protein n=1 Tax=Nocardiopsis halotolerans TaxID=124252 RepID=UPI00034657AF|nr:hypothetical protein [Nocardiopsis halotolerans]